MYLKIEEKYLAFFSINWMFDNGFCQFFILIISSIFCSKHFYAKYKNELYFQYDFFFSFFRLNRTTFYLFCLFCLFRNLIKNQWNLNDILNPDKNPNKKKLCFFNLHKKNHIVAHLSIFIFIDMFVIEKNT